MQRLCLGRDFNLSKVKNKSHAIVPDMQVKPGVDQAHVSWIGQYIADREPDVVVVLGDWWDMPSLSSYDAGKKSFEGRRYKADIESGKDAMAKFMQPIWAMKVKPRLVFLIGNHEERIERAIESDPKLDGTMGYHDLDLARYGWEVHKFLKPVVIDGIAYCHFFPRAASGAVMQTKRGAPDARAQLIREGRSCTAGHQQGLSVCCMPLAGKPRWGIIAGSAYRHDEEYLSPQGNAHWRGVIIKHDVKDGSFNPMFVGLDYLEQRYALTATRKRA